MLCGLRRHLWDESSMDSSRKILGRKDLREKLEGHRKRGERIVLTNGCFDMLHAGHVRYLKAARAEGEVVVVGVNADSSVGALKGVGRPILSEAARAVLVAGLEAVNYVVIFDEPNVEGLLRDLRPDVHAKGTDYTVDTVPERETAAKLGIRVAIVGDAKNHSTRDLIARIRDRCNA
jgi:D-glycero-beta-D-manno-heptose 1-phosphate adenylyltransferase